MRAGWGFLVWGVVVGIRVVLCFGFILVLANCFGCVSSIVFVGC